MKLHIFNPEHDIALAVNQPRFTAPHAGRQLRADLGFLPALWAADGDMVLVDDVEAALESVRHIKRYASDVVFVSVADLKNLGDAFGNGFGIEPWGWDITLCTQLQSANAALADYMPDASTLDTLRTMSSRRFAAEHLLPLLHDAHDEVVGESTYCASMQEALDTMKRYGKSVIKSPWSSSGRGVRYVPETTPDEHQQGWMRNVIKQQGGIMVEPLYAKVYDFGMEFRATEQGDIEYLGLSLFHTHGGSYTGSLLATETDKRDILSHYADMTLVDQVRAHIQQALAPLMRGVYVGAFGIDMMAVPKTNADGYWLHPCVELNLRRTMGHTALALTPNVHEPHRLMNIYYADKYRLRIQTIGKNLLNTGLI